MSVYLNANSSDGGQMVTASAALIVINLPRLTLASDPAVWNAKSSAFVAPVSGVYRLTGSATFSQGNSASDGVVMGFSVNQQWPSANAGASTGNWIVLRPGYFIQPTAQSVTALMKLEQGDTVQLAITGVDASRFGMSWNFLSINSV